MKALAASVAVSVLLAGCAVSPERPASFPTDGASASVSVSATSASASTVSTPSGTPTAPKRPAAPAGQFELPLVGAVGFAALTTLAKPDGDLVGLTLKPGDSFRIVAVKGADWVVRTATGGGRIPAKNAMVNLPDLIPSIVYRDTNGEASIFRSSGVALPGVTGVKLYNSLAENPRLGAAEHYMPVRYGVALRLQDVQKRALANGQTLVIYETFRPWDVQKKVGDSLVALAAKNTSVHEGLTRRGRDVSSFIARNLSNHQLGVAIDMTLGKVDSRPSGQGDEFSFTRTTAHELAMPSPIHELSEDAAAASWSGSKAAAAKQLQAYCQAAGLSPIASEWWHFEDRGERDIAKGLGVTGRYRLSLPAA